jgi:hypothetical protein
MMRDRGARKPGGAFADLVGGRALNRIRGHCEMCGAGVNNHRRFCLPCTDARHDDAQKRMRARRRAARKELEATTPQPEAS